MTQKHKQLKSKGPTLQSIAASTRRMIAEKPEIQERVRVLSSFTWDTLIPIGMQAGIDPDDDPHMSKMKLAQEIYIAETVRNASTPKPKLPLYEPDEFLNAVYRIHMVDGNKLLCLIYEDTLGVKLVSCTQWDHVYNLEEILIDIVSYDLITVS